MNRPTPAAPWYRYWERSPAADPGVPEDDEGWLDVERGPGGGRDEADEGAASGEVQGRQAPAAEGWPAAKDHPPVEDHPPVRHADAPATGGAPVLGAPADSGPFPVEPPSEDREARGPLQEEPSAESGAAPSPAGDAGSGEPFHVEPSAEPSAAPWPAGDAGSEEPFHVEPSAEPSAAPSPADDTVAVGASGARAEDAPAHDATAAAPPVEPVDRDLPGAGAPAAEPPSAPPAAVQEDAAPERGISEGPAGVDSVPSTHFDRARVLTIANQKGGVGKTTTAVSVAAALAELGSRILLVDLDPQGNATSGVGVKAAPNQPTIYDVLVGGVDLEDAIEPTSLRNLFVVPANLDLAGAEIELVSAFNREQKLRNALEPIRSEYDIVLIDCPPSLGLLTVNALSAGDGLLVPIQCEYYALEGLGALRRNADLIRAQLNPDLDITGFVLTMLDARTRLSQQVVDEVRAHFGDKVFSSRIPRSVRLAEAPGFGQPITVFDPSSRGALAYRRLAAELLQRLIANGPPPDRRTEGAPV